MTIPSVDVRLVPSQPVDTTPNPYALTSLILLEAARELERQNLADAVIAFDLADAACKHEQDQIANARRVLSLDQLPDAQRAAYLGNARVGLRLMRCVWRRVLWARTEKAAAETLTGLAGQWVPAARREELARHVAAAVWQAGIALLESDAQIGIKPTPREFATATAQVQRAKEGR